MPEVIVGTPAAGPPTWGYVESLMRLEPPPGGWGFLRPPRMMGVDLGRNWIVKKFLETDAKWLLWVDADAQLHPGTLLRLLSWDKPIVGALSFTKGAPPCPTVYRDLAPDGKWWVRVDEVHEWLSAHPQLHSHRAGLVEPCPPEALFQVDFTGCHCLLTHRSVYAHLQAPWFVGDDEGRGEDRYFCEKARAANFNIYVDLSVTTGHAAGERVLGALDFGAWYRIVDWREPPPQEG